jgi:hypothetical protein
MSWLSDLLGKTVKTEAETLPDRKVIRFMDPATVEDNPTEGSTDVTIFGDGFTYFDEALASLDRFYYRDLSDESFKYLYFSDLMNAVNAGQSSLSEIGEALSDTDTVHVFNDSASDAPRTSLMSRFWTYIQAKGAALSEIGGALAGDDTIRIIDATDSTEKRSSLFRITTFILAAIPATYGTWAPTVSNTNNMDSTPTVSGGFYLRFATIEIAFAQISFDPTAASGASEFRLTPPVSSNFAVNSDVVGLVGGLTITNGRCLADGTNDLIRCVFTNSGSAVDTAYVVAGCKVI